MPPPALLHSAGTGRSSSSNTSVFNRKRNSPKACCVVTICSQRQPLREHPSVDVGNSSNFSFLEREEHVQTFRTPNSINCSYLRIIRGWSSCDFGPYFKSVSAVAGSVYRIPSGWNQRSSNSH